MGFYLTGCSCWLAVNVHEFYINSWYVKGPVCNLFRAVVGSGWHSIPPRHFFKSVGSLLARSARVPLNNKNCNLSMGMPEQNWKKGYVGSIWKKGRSEIFLYIHLKFNISPLN